MKPIKVKLKPDFELELTHTVLIWYATTEGYLRRNVTAVVGEAGEGLFS